MYVIADLIASGLSIPTSRAAGLVDLYEAELNHLTYDASFMKRKREEIQEKAAAVRRKLAEEQRKTRETAAAVENLTITEEDLKRR
jgi:hypothetical protein